MPTRRPPPAPRLPWLRLPLAAALLAPAAPAAAQGGPLFPEPFVAEHRLVETGADGETFETEPVTDYYGGSWIVSVRPDGSRLVVDLARRELTEIRPDRGVYWSLDFGRLAGLTERAARAQWRERAGAADEEAGAATLAARAAPAELIVQELPAAGPGVAARSGGPSPTPAPAAPGVRRLRVVEADRAEDPEAGMEVWVDPSVRLRPVALDALTALETSLAGGRRLPVAEAAGGGPPVVRYLAAARAHAAGAVPVRTVRTLGPRPGEGPASARVRLEDVTTRLEPVDDFPEELVAVPEGLRRVPHPLEGVVAFLEDEAERNRRLSGGARD